MIIKNEDVKYLVFDVESVPDARLIKKVKYPEESIDEAGAVRKFQEEILEGSSGITDFIPVTFQYPIAVCIAKVAEDFSLLDIISLDKPAYRPQEIVRLFWHGVENLYNHSSLVTFNGRGFDIPLLELMAFRYGYQVKRHFKDKWAGRNRYSTKHIDLQDYLSNYNAIRMNGGLNLLAKVLGKPGKMSTKGDQVYEIFLQGNIQDINNYCIHDVLDTYFIFLRTRVLQGDITIEKEQDIVEKAKFFVYNNMERIPAFQEYFDNWGGWEPWP